MKSNKKMHAAQTRNVIVPLITPSKPGDFFPLIDHVIEGGIQDLVLFGTTGEGEKIDIESKKSIIRNIVPFINGRARLYIGLMCSNITEAIDLTNFCYELGFEGALLPPHLYGENPLKVVSNFLDNSSSKFILYNPPGANPLGKIVHTFDTARIIGLKDSSGDIALMKEITALPRLLSCKIYYGREHLLDKALELDIDGIFPGTGNIEPQLLLQLWKQRDEQSFLLFNQLKDLVRTNCPQNYIQGLKIELKNLGIING
jgi:4-hydroxy-tetrahydrodipicolinate synthase